MAEVPVWDRRTSTTRQATIPMLLPHEILATFVKHKAAAGTALFEHGGLDGQGARFLRASAAEVGVDLGETVPLGFWLDGVCTKWDRSSSHDMLCMSLPGMT
eukprot:7130743-Lingulodinium_polyedra.AAC.1